MKQNPESMHKGHIIELFTDNFNTTVMDSDDAWLIEFYNPKCVHCIRFAPTYKRVAEDLKGRVMVGRINVIAEPELVERFNVTAYPTIKGFKVGLAAKSDADIVDYPAEDNSEDLVVIFGKSLIDGEDAEIV
jgi:protein disulfide-isomerase A6